MTETQAGYAVYTPTLRERFWRKLGFRFHLGEDSEETVPWSGWMRTETRLCLGLADRLRILVGGELRMSTSVDMDTPSPSKTFTRFDWEILPPGDPRRRS